MIIISKILDQRYKKSNGSIFKENKFILLAKKEILKKIEDDKNFDLIQGFISDYNKLNQTKYN